MGCFAALKSITYNHLNLPQVIGFENGNSIEFVYTAAGTKLRKTVKTGGVITYEQDYVNGIEYRKVGTSRKVEAIYHQEGRRYNTNVETTSSTLALRYEFSMRDHLGNTRLTFIDKDGDGVIEVTNNTTTNEILQENHYYPFGMALNGPWMNDNALDNRYQYNGKEIDEDFGLKVYHYGARIYDPAIGRFTGVDPISDKFPWVSTYNYAENEPVANIDLWGLQRFYAADGSFIGSYGDSDEERVINDENKVRMARKVFAQGDGVQVKMFASKIFSHDDFSARLYRESDLNTIYDAFANKYRDESIEYVVTVYEQTFTDEDGNTFNGFQPGEPYTDRQRTQVYLSGSTFQGSGRWKIYSAIHNHPGKSDFSGYGSDPKDYPRYGIGDTNDLGWSIKNSAKVLLIKPYEDMISTFDPIVYSATMEKGENNKYSPVERNAAVRKAITTRKIGSK